MRIRNMAFIVLLASLLASCATTPIQPEPQNQTVSWDNRVQTLSTIENWNLKGLIAVRASKDAWSANWQWQQNHKNYTILMLAPIGSGSLKLTGSPEHVVLETSDGKTFTSSSAEELLAKQLGWQLPVSRLLYWVRGLPAPGIPAQKEFDSYHHLTGLVQGDWVIHYLRYTSVNHIDVPNKIFLENPQISVKIIINQWQL